MDVDDPNLFVNASSMIYAQAARPVLQSLPQPQSDLFSIEEETKQEIIPRRSTMLGTKWGLPIEINDVSESMLN